MWPYRLIAGLYAKAFPEDIFVYVLDERKFGDFSRDVESTHTIDSQRRDGVRIVALPVADSNVFNSLGELLDAFDQTFNEPKSNKLFIRLKSPTRTSKKELRASIDDQRRFTGDVRVRLLMRVVPFVEAERDFPGNSACEQFSDDLAYSKWTFGALAVRMEDRTMDLIGECIGKHIVQILRTSPVVQ